MAKLNVKSKSGCTWDVVSLGEVMLRLDPRDERISTTRHFRVWEGGGEYNVARGLRRCFGMETAIVTALADNPVGRLVEDLMLQGGVSQKYVRWTPYDGVGRTVHNGLNFTERGFGLRAALGCSDRGHTAISQLKPGRIDWEQIFRKDGARGLHTGGIYCALSETAPLVAQEAMTAAKNAGVVVSYDLNYRASLWKSIGGKAKAQETNRLLAPLVDVMLGNEEDFMSALGFEVAGLDEQHSKARYSKFPGDDQESGAGIPHAGCHRHNTSKRPECDRERLGSGVLLRRGVLPGAGSRKSRDFRSCWRRRLLCLRIDLWIFGREGSAVGR
jgi:2-dehydro-3-deoxygluconokinase